VIRHLVLMPHIRVNATDKLWITPLLEVCDAGLRMFHSRCSPSKQKDTSFHAQRLGEFQLTGMQDGESVEAQTPAGSWKVMRWPSPARLFVQSMPEAVNRRIKRSSPSLFPFSVVLVAHLTLGHRSAVAHPCIATSFAAARTKSSLGNPTRQRIGRCRSRQTRPGRQTRDAFMLGGKSGAHPVKKTRRRGEKDGHNRTRYHPRCR
jgi:hypothetical protein